MPTSASASRQRCKAAGSARGEDYAIRLWFRVQNERRVLAHLVTDARTLCSGVRLGHTDASAAVTRLGVSWAQGVQPCGLAYAAPVATYRIAVGECAFWNQDLLRRLPRHQTGDSR